MTQIESVERIYETWKKLGIVINSLVHFELNVQFYNFDIFNFNRICNCKTLIQSYKVFYILQYQKMNLNRKIIWWENLWIDAWNCVETKN